MIDHLSIRVRDIQKSKTFLAKALAPLGYEVLMEFGEFLGLGADKKPDLWSKAAIQAGGKDNGKPGIRKDYHPSYYGAFVIDPDGHNLEAVCHKPE